MNPRALVPLLVVAVVAWFVYSQYREGRTGLPGLPDVKPDPNGIQIPVAIDPNTPASPDPTASQTPAVDPNAAPGSGPVATTDPDPQSIAFGDPREVLQLLRQDKPAQAIALADAHLVKHPTDALIALARSSAVSKLTGKPVLEIGLSAPLSGPLKQVGEAFAQGVNMAVQEANKQGGINGQRIDVAVLNDAGDKAQAIEVASRFLQNPAVLGVVGPYSSSTTLAASELYNQGLPVIAPAATNPKIAQAGPYIFRVAPSDLEQGIALARLVKSRQHKAVAVLFDPDDAYSKGLAEAFTAEAERIGLTFSEVEFKLNQYTTAKVGNYAVDAIFVAGYTADVAAVAKLEWLQRHEIFAGDGAYGQDLIAQGKDKVQGVIVTSFWHATLQDARSQAFTKAFRARYGGGTPNANAVQAYDAARTLLEALRRSKSKTREDLKAALETFQTKPGLGVTAPVRFDANGDVVKRPFVAITVKDGQFNAIGLTK